MHRPDEFSAAYHLGLSLQAGRVTLEDLAAGLQLLEPMCVTECAKRPDRAEIVVPALNASIDASAELVGDGVAFTQAAREFHDLIVSFTPNATIRYAVRSYVACGLHKKKPGPRPSPAEASTRPKARPKTPSTHTAASSRRSPTGALPKPNDSPDPTSRQPRRSSSTASATPSSTHQRR